MLFILVMLLLLVLFILRYVGNYIYPYKKRENYLLEARGRYFRNLPTKLNQPPFTFFLFIYEVFL